MPSLSPLQALVTLSPAFPLVFPLALAFAFLLAGFPRGRELRPQLLGRPLYGRFPPSRLRGDYFCAAASGHARFRIPARSASVAAAHSA